MIKKVEGPLTDLKKKILTEIKVIQEIKNMQNSLAVANDNDKKKISSHVKTLELYFEKVKNEIISSLDELTINSPLPNTQQLPVSVPPQNYEPEFIQQSPGFSLKEVEQIEEENEDYKYDASELEKETLKRLKRKEKKEIIKKEKKPSWYIKSASKMFADFSRKIVKKGYFKLLEKDLIKANMEFVLPSYVSLILYTTLLATVAGFFVFLFFLFFNIGVALPIITLTTESIGLRFLKVFWIVIFAPLATFIAMYFYPSLETKAEEAKINQELPFATINMAAISGSMIDLTKIFEIIITTQEYPAITKEFTKLLNQVNVYGYDVVGALRNMAYNSPSRKLTDLFNGLATAITSGGDLPDYFDKRASSLLFEHKLEKEKQAKAAETFMDIYISVVVAAPMILMLLLMMLKIGGLGIGLSTGAITLMMVLGVVTMNIFFLTFLHLRQPSE